jgi:hypothetical protein
MPKLIWKNDTYRVVKNDEGKVLVEEKQQDSMGDARWSQVYWDPEGKAAAALGNALAEAVERNVQGKSAPTNGAARDPVTT